MKFSTNRVPSNLYPRLVQKIINYSIRQLEFVEKNGSLLTKDSQVLASKMGVKQTSKVKLYSSNKSIFSSDAKLDRLMQMFGISKERTGGITVGYSIALNANCSDNLMILAHELRHVAQFEACGSLNMYIDYYLMEISYFGYGKGPLEMDAQLASVRYAG